MNSPPSKTNYIVKMHSSLIYVLLWRRRIQRYIWCLGIKEYGSEEYDEFHYIEYSWGINTFDVEINRDGVRVGIERQLDSDESDMEEDHTRLNHCLRVQYKNHDLLLVLLIVFWPVLLTIVVQRGSFGCWLGQSLVCFNFFMYSTTLLWSPWTWERWHYWNPMLWFAATSDTTPI